MNLPGIRKRIDQVDRELLLLILERMELVVRAGRLKREITDPKREQDVLSLVMRNSRGLLDPTFSETLYKEIMAEAKRLQANGTLLVGFQGEHGAFSEIAAKQFFPEGLPLPHRSFKEVYEGVLAGTLDFGVVPVENSLGGAVSDVEELQRETSLHTVGEITVPIAQCLLTLPDTGFEAIQVVYSHPQALSQCKRFVEEHSLEPRYYYDTAGAAKMLARERVRCTAVIASEHCAELYDLKILRKNIQDEDTNITRFIALSRDPKTMARTS